MGTRSADERLTTDTIQRGGFAKNVLQVELVGGHWFGDHEAADSTNQWPALRWLRTAPLGPDGSLIEVERRRIAWRRAIVTAGRSVQALDLLTGRTASSNLPFVPRSFRGLRSARRWYARGNSLEHSQVRRAITEILVQIRMLEAAFPGIKRVPWHRDWMIEQAGTRSTMTIPELDRSWHSAALAATPLLARERLTVIPMSHLSLPAISFETTASKEMRRGRANKALNEILAQRYAEHFQTAVPDRRSPRFAGWKASDPTALEAFQHLEQRLAAMRPLRDKHGLDPLPRDALDVMLWTTVNLDTISCADLASDAADQNERDSSFRSSGGSSRSLVPTTTDGVSRAVQRADSLLRTAR